MKDRFIVKICITGSDWKLNQTIGRMSAENVFDDDPSPTIGVDITTKKMIVDNNEVKLILNNLPGQEVFGRPRRRYYEGSIGCVIIFNKNNNWASFDAVPQRHQDYQKDQGTDKPVVILGVTTDSEEITTEEGERLAKTLKCLYFETALTDKNQIETVFHKLTKRAIEL